MEFASCAEEGLEVLRSPVQDRCSVCEECLAVCTAQGTLDLVVRAVHCPESFIETPVVPGVGTKLSSLCDSGPPFILHLTELTLEVATDKTEGSFLLRACRLSKVGLVRISLIC